MVVAAFGYQTFRRRYSGDIQTTEAKGLWKEAHDLRETLARSNTRLDERVDELGLTVDDLHSQLSSAMAENNALKMRIAVLEHESARKDDELALLKQHRITLEKRVAELEEELRRRMEAAKTSIERFDQLKPLTPTEVESEKQL